jgi:hypothetical protein
MRRSLLLSPKKRQQQRVSTLAASIDSWQMYSSATEQVSTVTSPFGWEGHTVFSVYYSERTIVDMEMP